VQTTARHVVAVVWMYVVFEHRQRRRCVGAVLEDGRDWRGGRSGGAERE
jgi:hypothetical protein